MHGDTLHNYVTFWIGAADHEWSEPTFTQGIKTEKKMCFTFNMYFFFNIISYMSCIVLDSIYSDGSKKKLSNGSSNRKMD